MFCIIMGVSGSGKSTIGKLLSDRTGWTFYDADDFHPVENIAKMSRGIPLNDKDREPWLLTLEKLIDNAITQEQNVILACSALKSSYRRKLKVNHPKVALIYLQGDYEQILSRIKQRKGHFMQAEMLRSQFKILEEPQADLVFSVSLSSDAIIEKIINYLDYSWQNKD